LASIKRQATFHSIENKCVALNKDLPHFKGRVWNTGKEIKAEDFIGGNTVATLLFIKWSMYPVTHEKFS